MVILLTPITYMFGIDVVFADGIVDIKYADGELVEAFIGDVVTTGDTVITGETGVAELEPARGSLIKVRPDTVFTVGEIEINREKRTILSTTLGAVRFTFDRWSGKEPLVATPIAVAGVRGTELEVFAGSDGSVLIVVAVGAVQVTAENRAVDLTANEGVEIEPGSPPGKKFEVLRGQMDFSTWNGVRESKILDNPIAALESASNGLNALIREIEILVPVFEANRAKLESLRDQLRNEKDADKRKSTYEQTVFPLEVETSYLALNIRYYALSALSYRRFVLGTIYLRTHLQIITGNTAIDFDAFMRSYEDTLNKFERKITPHLVVRDI